MTALSNLEIKYICQASTMYSMARRRHQALARKETRDARRAIAAALLALALAAILLWGVR